MAILVKLAFVVKNIQLEGLVPNTASKLGLRVGEPKRCQESTGSYRMRRSQNYKKLYQSNSRIYYMYITVQQLHILNKSKLILLLADWRTVDKKTWKFSFSPLYSYCHHTMDSYILISITLCAHQNCIELVVLGSYYFLPSRLMFIFA